MNASGFVIRADKNTAVVEIKRGSMCSSCHKEGGCSGCADVMVITADNPVGAKKGDLVEVSSPTSRTLFYAFLVFMLPLIAAGVGYAVGGAISELFSYIFLALGFVLVFAGLVLVFEIKKKKNAVGIVRILTESKSEVSCGAVLSEKETVE